MSNPTPHLALVTGAGRRLGRAIALKLAEAGCDVAVHYNRSALEAAEVVAAIETMGRRARAVSFDQSDAAAIATGMAEITAAFGRAPDVLVNSASIYEQDRLGSVTHDSLRRHYDANVAGPVLLTQAVAAQAGDATRGLIINLLDFRLMRPRDDDHLSYTLSKYALQGFTNVMARQLAPRFRVCAIAPGYTLPDVDAASDAHFNDHSHKTPLGRGPSADDIANAAAFLLASPSVTGQTIIVDGGAFLGRPAR